MTVEPNGGTAPQPEERPISSSARGRTMVQQTDPQVHLSPMAGKPATKDMLVDVANLEREYYERKPDVSDPNQMVSFGTSGHRGHAAEGDVHRGAHPGDHAGDLRLPARAGRGWSTVHGERYACGVRSGAEDSAGGAGGERASKHSSSAEDGIHADAGDLARHSDSTTVDGSSTWAMGLW